MAAMKCTVIASTSATLIDVITGISRLVIVPLWCRLEMN
jgi:hypothetical protein